MHDQRLSRTSFRDEDAPDRWEAFPETGSDRLDGGITPLSGASGE